VVQGESDIHSLLVSLLISGAVRRIARTEGPRTAGRADFFVHRKITRHGQPYSVEDKRKSTRAVYSLLWWLKIQQGVFLVDPIKPSSHVLYHGNLFSEISLYFRITHFQRCQHDFQETNKAVGPHVFSRSVLSCLCSVYSKNHTRPVKITTQTDPRSTGRSVATSLTTTAQPHTGGRGATWKDICQFNPGNTAHKVKDYHLARWKVTNWKLTAVHATFKSINQYLPNCGGDL